VATLATLDRDGLPQLTEVWFLHDDDGELKLSLNSTRHKTRNLQDRPQCSLLLLDLDRPHRYLEVRGHARVEADPDGVFARKLGTKYDADPTLWDGPDESRLIVTIEPVKIHPVNMHGD
jgi:PPOX class probable F420-dependent enzyme